MLIEIHIIQNHGPSNLNRDDLGAPKSCYFGGVLRSRISSQCIKRSIRTSEYFKDLPMSFRTRKLAQLIAYKGTTSPEIGDNIDSADCDLTIFDKASKILEQCGVGLNNSNSNSKPNDEEDNESNINSNSKAVIFISREAVKQMKKQLAIIPSKSIKELTNDFLEIICDETYASDLALFGRMLEPKKVVNKDKKDNKEQHTADENEQQTAEKSDKKNKKNKNFTVEAASQVAHAISTHGMHQEIDYFITSDDIKGNDAGAGFLDESMFSSACFYKYFSINWDGLLDNLNNQKGTDPKDIAYNTIEKFINAASLVNPSGKQNSFAAHDKPSLVLIEFKNAPISYANAFASPVELGANLISNSLSQLADYIKNIDEGYGKPINRFWFAVNDKNKLMATLDEKNQVNNFNDFVNKVISTLKSKT